MSGSGIQSSVGSSSVGETRDDQEKPGEWSEGLDPFGITPWVLPGRGESGPRCGVWQPESVCETCGEPNFVEHRCGRRSCPDCWGSWALDAAVRATVRLQAYRYQQPEDWRRQAAHAVVSPPEGDVRTKDDYWRWRSKAGEIAQEKGWRGFAVIPHPYRPTDEAKERFRREDPDCGIWVWLRNDVEDMMRLVKWSPHYHIVGATGADMDPAKESDEYVYRFIRSAERFDGIEDTVSHEDVYGLFRYLLSHTGFPEGSSKQTTTWYGELSNSVFVEEATESWQVEKPSDEVLSKLELTVRDAVGLFVDEESDEDVGVEKDGLDGCSRKDCDGVMIDVFDVSAYLRSNKVDSEVEKWMKAMRDWRLGRVEPPPGLKHPESREEVREAAEEIVDGGDRPARLWYDGGWLSAGQTTL